MLSELINILKNEYCQEFPEAVNVTFSINKENIVG